MVLAFIGRAGAFATPRPREVVLQSAPGKFSGGNPHAPRERRFLLTADRWSIHG
jgi:hypothetical protein